MLNEIVKGMDNAAEIIDQNFKYLGVLADWEIGENSNGHYFKHPSGWMICFTPEYSSASRAREWVFPIPFVGPVPRVFALPAANTSIWQGAKTLESITINTEASTWIQGFAVGYWKELDAE